MATLQVVVDDLDGSVGVELYFCYEKVPKFIGRTIVLRKVPANCGHCFFYIVIGIIDDVPDVENLQVFTDRGEAEVFRRSKYDNWKQTMIGLPPAYLLIKKKLS